MSKKYFLELIDSLSIPEEWQAVKKDLKFLIKKGKLKTEESICLCKNVLFYQNLNYFANLIGLNLIHPTGDGDTWVVESYFELVSYPLLKQERILSVPSYIRMPLISTIKAEVKE
ncbi:hypothetical protein IPdc08_01309 [archaeon]|nr:hypothetical protein IPdc08_01309 [archaeon]